MREWSTRTYKAKNNFSANLIAWSLNGSEHESREDVADVRKKKEQTTNERTNKQTNIKVNKYKLKERKQIYHLKK